MTATITKSTPLDPPKPLPRTKFLQKSVSEESSAPPTLQVISQNLPASAAPPVPPAKGKYISARPAPPKPPRTPSLRDSPTSPSQDAPPRPRRPGLMDVLSRPSPAPPASSASPASGARPQPASTTKPTRPALPDKAAGLGAVPTRRAPRPRLLPLSLPPPPTAKPPRVPSNTSAPRVPSRPSPDQLASARTQASASSSGPAPPLTVGLRTASNVQSPVCSVEDFEGGCKEVFRNTRTAKELSARGKHVQAASHYQKSLTALDRVLRAQVLSLTQHEPTRQRLFLLQQEVFSLRKEALNGFTDAQTAVRTPRGLSPPPSTPGAPPSYEDVLKEDNHRRRDDPPRPSRQSSTQGTTSSSSHPPPVASRPRPRPVPTQPPATHRPSTRTRSHSIGDSRVEDLVDVRGTASQGPTTAPPAIQPPHRYMKPTLISGSRPRSSYHPLTQPEPPMSLPPADTSHVSLPPPLLPVSLPPASLPSQHAEATSQDHTPSPVPVLDEAVLSQMKELQVYERDKFNTPASHPQKELLPFSKDNLPERKGKESITSNGSDAQLLETTVKDETKNKRVPSVSSVEDPFLSIDPFLPVNPQSKGNDVVFMEETQDAQTLPAASGSLHNHSNAFSDDFNPEASLTADSLSPKVTQKKSLSPVVTQSPADNLGDSILEALDFAITPVPGHRRVSPQHSRERTARSYSEENLLDSSHNTLEAILHPTRDRHASRASIIEEFDPLLTSHTPQEHKQEEKSREEVCEQMERETWKEKESEVAGILPPKPAPRKKLQSSCTSDEDTVVMEGEGEIYGTPPHYYAEGGAVALECERGAVALEDDGGTDDYYTSGRYPGTHSPSDGVKGRMSYSSSEDSSSMYSWPPDYTAGVSTNPASPVYPCMYPEEEEEEEEEESEGAGVGRSSFYLPPSTQGETKRRNLLSIREGVKIFFIHTDGIVTSPWRKPFLAVSRDPTKDKMFGSGLMLSVGNSLWGCELQKKATLVLRTQSGCYVFSEVAGKPDCKAVAIRVPSGVRRAQQELLSNILLQNTQLEEERPKGITKAISKSASSAATRMNKLVEDRSMTPTQPFVRRNSIRALKGVTKRLTTIAEKTGGTLKELPEEYRVLQEAADTLAFARSAKMIQYI